MNETLVGLLRKRAGEEPGANLWRWLIDGEREGPSMSCSELDQRARAIATKLRTSKLKTRPRARALLLYPPGLEFIEGFFGCLYAGMIAVPAYAPGLNRDFTRIRGMFHDSGCSLVLTSQNSLQNVTETVNRIGSGVPCIVTDTVACEISAAWVDVEACASDVAYLQYTSGSTSAPKGAIVTHANVLENLAYIAAQGEFCESSVSVGWLPHFHDEGHDPGPGILSSAWYASMLNST